MGEGARTRPSRAPAAAARRPQQRSINQSNWRQDHEGGREEREGGEERRPAPFRSAPPPAAPRLLTAAAAAAAVQTPSRAAGCAPGRHHSGRHTRGWAGGQSGASRGWGRAACRRWPAAAEMSVSNEHSAMPGCTQVPCQGASCCTAATSSPPPPNAATIPLTARMASCRKQGGGRGAGWVLVHRGRRWEGRPGARAAGGQRSSRAGNAGQGSTHALPGRKLYRALLPRSRPKCKPAPASRGIHPAGPGHSPSWARRAGWR